LPLPATARRESARLVNLVRRGTVKRLMRRSSARASVRSSTAAICPAMLGERYSRGVEHNATNTVKTYTRELCRKLGTTSPADAAARSRTVCSSQINHRGGPRPALANPGPPSARFGCQGPARTDLRSRAHADQPPPDRFRDRSSAHVRAPIDGIEPVMSARAAAVSPLIVAVARSRRSASVPGGICTNHWPRSSRTSVTDDPAPLDTLEVRARHAASEGPHRTLRYQRAALPAGQFSMTPTVSYPSRS
jgi:hypothetical protein